jgi:hypothetical protein
LLKTGIFKTPPKPHSCERIPPEKNKKNGILRNPVFFYFSVQKINSCQTGITNLGPMHRQHFIGIGSIARYIGEAMDRPPICHAFIMAEKSFDIPAI